MQYSLVSYDHHLELGERSFLNQIQMAREVFFLVGSPKVVLDRGVNAILPNFENF